MAGGLYWMFFREPPGPKQVSYVLKVYSTPPGASVSLNGRPTGLSTDEDGIELPVSGLVNDSVLVETRLDGYEPASSEVALAESPPDPVEFVLARSIRTFELQTSPAGATVRLDGKLLEGATPFSIEIPAGGDHEIVISKEEYRPVTLRVSETQPFPREPIVLAPLGRPGTLAVESSYPVAIFRGESTLAPESESPTTQLRPGSTSYG
jgi:hypothetical protein